MTVVHTTPPTSREPCPASRFYPTTPPLWQCSHSDPCAQSAHLRILSGLLTVLSLRQAYHVPSRKALHIVCIHDTVRRLAPQH